MHSKFPWTNHPHTPTAVFDGDGRRIIDQWVAPEDWFPIETAPKDGSEILVWRPHENSDHPAHIGIDLWKMYDSKGVWWRSRPGQFPTHWRPLPTPPSDAPAPTPLDPETAAANAVMIAAIPQMLEALEPFAKLAQLAHEGHRDSRPIVYGFDIAISQRLTIGDLRRAAAALASIRRVK